MSISLADSRVGVVQFTPTARPEFYPTDYIRADLIKQAVDRMPYAPCLGNARACHGDRNSGYTLNYASQVSGSQSLPKKTPFHNESPRDFHCILHDRAHLSTFSSFCTHFPPLLQARKYSSEHDPFCSSVSVAPPAIVHVFPTP